MNTAIYTLHVMTLSTHAVHDADVVIVNDSSLRTVDSVPHSEWPIVHLNRVEAMKFWLQKLMFWTCGQRKLPPRAAKIDNRSGTTVMSPRRTSCGHLQLAS